MRRPILLLHGELLNCPQCHGTGRDVCRLHEMTDGGPVNLPMINGLCLVCHGSGIIHCCDGDRAEAILAVVSECNPND